MVPGGRSRLLSRHDVTSYVGYVVLRCLPVLTHRWAPLLDSTLSLAVILQVRLPSDVVHAE